jgi:hypothetical protein
MKVRHLFISRRSNQPDKTKVSPSNWNDPHVNEDGNPVEVIGSYPPTGMFKVTNIFVDPETGFLAVQYDDGK